MIVPVQDCPVRQGLRSEAVVLEIHVTQEDGAVVILGDDGHPCIAYVFVTVMYRLEHGVYLFRTQEDIVRIVIRVRPPLLFVGLVHIAGAWIYLERIGGACLQVPEVCQVSKAEVCKAVAVGDVDIAVVSGSEIESHASVTGALSLHMVSPARAQGRVGSYERERQFIFRPGQGKCVPYPVHLEPETLLILRKSADRQHGTQVPELQVHRTSVRNIRDFRIQRVGLGLQLVQHPGSLRDEDSGRMGEVICPESRLFGIPRPHHW